MTVMFRREWFNWFLWILASLIKNGRTLRKCYLFSYRYKNVWDIGICLKPHFYKKCVNNFKTLGQSFLELRQISLRALQFYICKFEINCYRRTRCTNSWSNLTSKCNANTFVKVDALIEGNYRRTISYLQGCSWPKLHWDAINWVIRNLQEEQLYAECGARVNNFYLSKLLCIFSSLFAKNFNKARYNMYGNPVPVFSTEGSRLEEK